METPCAESAVKIGEFKNSIIRVSAPQDKYGYLRDSGQAVRTGKKEKEEKWAETVPLPPGRYTGRGQGTSQDLMLLAVPILEQFHLEIALATAQADARSVGGSTSYLRG